MRWKIAIAVYPHSTGNGRDADNKAAGAGDGDLYFYVDSQDFQDAVKFAECFAQGVEANPAVWRAPIMSIHRCERTR